ncbi:MAG: putative transport protein YhhT [Gammaproteobacteria bacterium]|nr:putative transport protein YhhT [Gammaproteobacteria bacterium]
MSIPALSRVTTLPLAILATLALFYVLWVGQALLVPLAIAVLVWYAINALAHLYARLLFKGQTNGITLILSLVTIAIGAGIVVNIIQTNIADVRQAAPTYKTDLDQWLVRIYDLLGIEDLPTLSQFMASVDIGPIVANFAGALTGIVGDLALIVVYVGFLLYEQKTFSNKLQKMFPEAGKRREVRAVIENIQSQIETYIWIKTAVSVVTGLVGYVVLTLVGVDFASFWAFAIFLLNYIPIIGSVIATLFPALLTLIQFDTFTPFLIVGIGLTSAQFVVGNVIEPKLMGSSLNLSPLVVLLSLALWGSLWGIPGMFLCVPIMVIFLIILSHFNPTRPLAVMLSERGELTDTNHATTPPE